VDLNHAFSLALDGKADVGSSLGALEHPLAAALSEACQRGDGSSFRSGRCTYEVQRSNAGRTVVLGRPLLDAGDDSTYKALFLQASGPMLLLDRSQGTVVDANHAAALLLGRPRDQLGGMKAAMVLERCPSGNEWSDERFLARCRAPSGYELKLEVDCRPIIMDDRELVLASIRTPEQNGIEEVLECEHRYRALSDAAFEGVVIHSNNIIMDCNQTFAEITGLPRERLIGLNLMELVHPVSRELVMRQVAGGRHEPYEVLICTGGEAYRLIEVRGREITHKGRPARVAAFHDVTERERAWTGLERERAMLRATMDSLPVGVIITDPLGGFVEINEMASTIWGGPMEAEDIFDYDRFVAYDQQTGELVRPEEWGLARALLHGETLVGSLYDIVRFDGGRRSVVMSTAPVKGPEGEILGGVEITQDITHQKELERRAGIADVKAELYVDILTHDIANLNTALMGYLELLHQKVCTDTLAASHLDKSLRVLQASNDLISIIQRVQSAGEGAREREDLGEMIHAVASELPVPPGRTVHLEQESEEGLMVECNGLLREVFVNLLNNAIVHTKGEVHVRVEAKRVDDRAIVSVENDGEGIDDALKARLFHRRVRGSSLAPGQGLGLFLIRTLVEDHGGNVWVEDRVAGDSSQGVRFVVSLPLVGPQGGRGRGALPMGCGQTSS